MKKILIIVLALIFANNISAQVFIGKIKPSKSIYLNSPKELKTADFNKIKNTKTFFIYEEEIYNTSFSKSEFEVLIKNVWNITEYEVIENSEILDKVEVGNAIVYFTHSELRVLGSGRAKDGTENTRVEFGILKEFKKKKKKIELDIDIYANLYVNIGSRTSVGVVSISQNKPMELKIGAFQFMNYIKFVNDKLKNNESYISWKDYAKPIIKELKGDTLYATYFNLGNNTLQQYFDAGTKKEEIDSFWDNKFKKAIFKVKVLSENELSELLYEKTKNNETIYYLVTNPSRHFKVVNVFDNKGNIVFQNYQGASWMLNKKDIKNLNKAIEKGKF